MPIENIVWLKKEKEDDDDNGMDAHTRRDIRDMAREAKFQTQLLTQQGNSIASLTVLLCYFEFIYFPIAKSDKSSSLLLQLRH